MQKTLLLATQFLTFFDKNGWHNLVAIHPETGAISGKTFAPQSWPRIEDWINHHINTHNLYFSVNEPLAGAPDKKLTKNDIGAIRAICVDLDPDPSINLAEARQHILTIARKPATLPPPTFAIDSGGGAQVFWALQEKLDRQKYGTLAEDAGRGLIACLGGDNTHNLDRIMRLPGTVNYPNRAKYAKGRTITPTALLYKNDNLYNHKTVSTFANMAPAKTQKIRDSNVNINAIALDMDTIRTASSFEELPVNLQDKFTATCDKNREIFRLWSGDDSLLRNDHTGSGWRGTLAYYLSRAGFTVEEYGRLLWIWPYAIQAGDNLHEKINARQIARDWARRGDAAMALLTDISPEQITALTAKIKAMPARPKLQFVSLMQAAQDAQATLVKPLIKGLLDQGAMTVLYGESNTGKTFVAMDMAFHISCGLAWGGKRTTQMPVLYVAAEGQAGARKRAAALKAHFGEKAEEAEFHMLLASVDLLHVNADTKPLIESVRALEKKTGLIVIDTLSRALAGGDENTSTDMGALVKHADLIRRYTGAHLMFVHHTGKDKARGARGHSLLRAATDTEIEIADRQITVTKQRDIDGDFASGFELQVIDLWQDLDGDRVTSCTVQLVDAMQVRAGTPTTREEDILRIIETLLQLMPDQSKGISVREIMTYCAQDKIAIQMTENSMRKWLSRLKEKKLINSAGRGRWVLSRQAQAFTLLDRDPDIFT